jgi:transposase
MVLYVRDRHELHHLIVTMCAEGWSVRALARHFGVSRNTVRRMLRTDQTQRDEGHNLLLGNKGILPRKSKLDPFAPLIQTLLGKYPSLTAVRLWEELKDAGYQGGLTIVRERLQLLRPRPKKEPVIRFETDPGVQGQMDWSPYTIPFTRTGKKQVLCFSYILAFSRRQYIDFTERRDFFTLIRRHQAAFEHFGGVTRECLYDGEKTVLLRWEAGRPVYNPAFIAFITHYHCRPIMCRAGRAETKGKIEAPFQYVEKNLLGGRDFENLEDLRATARWWLREKSDHHRHDTTGRPPLELFLEEEKDALQPLPLHPYDSSEVALRVCSVEGLLEFETNRYSVPYEFVADILSLKATENEIFIYSPELQLIARHERLPRGANRTVEDPRHRTTKSLRWGLEPVKEAFLALGEQAEPFLAGLKEKHRNCGFHVRFILRLKEQFHSDDIHKALEHAMRYWAFDSKAIERILRAKATPRTLESIRNEQARDDLSKTLPEIQQRSLDDYADLILEDGPENETP